MCLWIRGHAGEDQCGLGFILGTLFGRNTIFLHGATSHPQQHVLFGEIHTFFVVYFLAVLDFMCVGKNHDLDYLNSCPMICALACINHYFLCISCHV